MRSGEVRGWWSASRRRVVACRLTSMSEKTTGRREEAGRVDDWVKVAEILLAMMMIETARKLSVQSMVEEVQEEKRGEEHKKSIKQETL